MADSTISIRFLGDSASAVRATNSLGSSFGGLSRVARLATRAVGVGLVGGLALAIKSAGDFEKVLNVLQATSGASNKEMERLSALAKRLGADMSLPATSARDAADAMLELSKGGLSLRDTMKAARGVLELSAAAQIDNASAAKIVANALNAFNLEGDQAIRVADTLANAANKSTGDIGDFAMGLQQSAASASQLGIPLEDTVAALTLMADAGIQGSDAGTSLKTMLQRLVPVTAKQSGLMKELGIRFFDSSGEFIGLAGAAEEVRDALGPMNQKEREAALNVLFGSDARRAAIEVLLEGEKAVRREAKAVSESGTAHRLAKAQTEGFAGALEGFKSAAETALIVIGEQLLPVATEGMRRLAEAVDTHAEGAASAIGRIADAGGDVIDVMGDIGGVIGTDLGLSLSGGVLAMVGFALAVSKAIDVVKALRLALLGINPIIGLVSLAVGALAVAYIDARLRTDEFAQATDRAKQAMRNLVPAADEAKRADVALASARANLKAANVAVKDAEDALHEARKKGKPRDVARAEASLAQARAGARQAALGVEDAEKRNTDATKKLRAEKQRARDAVAQFDQKMGGLEQRMRQTQGRARGVKDRLGELNEEARKKAVARLAKEASDLADEGRSVADQLEKTNPKLAATMRNAADAAAAMGALADAWGRVISLPEARAFVARFSVITTVETNRVNRAAGGFVPGPRGAGDVVPAMLSPGEVVLNRAQQMRLGGPARIASMFGFTGSEGPGFARGGLVSGLRAHGIDQIEQKYGLLQRLYGLPGSEAGEEFGPHETRRLVRNRQGLVNALQRERRRVRRKLRRDDDLEPFERRDLKRRLREIPFDITAARLDIRELRGQGRADGGGPDVDALIAQLGQLRLALGIQTSQLGILGSFARGTAFVPETGLAVLHRGEAVIPASKVRGGDGAFTPTIVVENHFAPGMEWLERFVDTRVRTSGNVDAVSSRIGARASERARARRF